MASIQRFEDLIAWQKARELTQKIYTITMQGDFPTILDCVTKSDELQFLLCLTSPKALNAAIREIISDFCS
jgi:hypothetical protein